METPKVIIKIKLQFPGERYGNEFPAVPCRWQHLKGGWEGRKKIPGWETLVMTAEALCDTTDIEGVMKASPASPTPPPSPPVTGDGSDKASHTSSLSTRHDSGPYKPVCVWDLIQGRGKQ